MQKKLSVNLLNFFNHQIECEKRRLLGLIKILDKSKQLHLNRSSETESEHKLHGIKLNSRHVNVAAAAHPHRRAHATCSRSGHTASPSLRSVNVLTVEFMMSHAKVANLPDILKFTITQTT